MRACEIFVNGERLCLAGIDGAGVLAVIVDDVKGKLEDNLQLSVGGLVSATGEHLRWTMTPLKTGDEVRVHIVESASADEPETRQLPDSAEDIERQKAYVRAMIQKLGWTVIERPDLA